MPSLIVPHWISHLWAESMNSLSQCVAVAIVHLQLVRTGSFLWAVKFAFQLDNVTTEQITHERNTEVKGAKERWHMTLHGRKPKSCVCCVISSATKTSKATHVLRWSWTIWKDISHAFLKETRLRPARHILTESCLLKHSGLLRMTTGVVRRSLRYGAACDRSSTYSTVVR